MKLLIIISSHELNHKWCDNIQILHDYMKKTGWEFEYCGISNQDDFCNYESIIQFKYKIINSKLQLSKICDFITEYKSQLDYDWYIKIRPDIKLLDAIPFDILSEHALNARARVYNGPRKIKCGMSVNGEGCWRNIGQCYYADSEHNIVMDDMLYIFHNNLVQQNAFDPIPGLTSPEHEWEHTRVFNNRNIKLNIIGINLCMTKYNTFSGNINME